MSIAAARPEVSERDTSATPLEGLFSTTAALHKTDSRARAIEGAKFRKRNCIPLGVEKLFNSQPININRGRRPRERFSPLAKGSRVGADAPAHLFEFSHIMPHRRADDAHVYTYIHM